MSGRPSSSACGLGAIATSVLLGVGCGGSPTVASSPPAASAIPLDTQPRSDASAPESATDPGPLATSDPVPHEPERPFERGGSGFLPDMDLRGCSTPEGPRGLGHVTIVFRSDGTPISVTFDAGPFAGTAEGACILSRFRRIRVPAFQGRPQRMGKTFALTP